MLFQHGEFSLSQKGLPTVQKATNDKIYQRYRTKRLERWHARVQSTKGSTAGRH